MELSVRYEEIFVLGEKKKNTPYISDNPLYLKFVYVKV